MTTTKILYLEDNEADVELVRMVLHKRMPSVDVSIANNKELFFDKIASSQFDVILMDYDMPGFPAMDAIQYVKSKNIHLPIIIISGAVGYETTVELIKHGAHDYILKDNLINLPNAIERALSDFQKNVVKKEQENTQKEALKITQTGIFKTDIQGHCTYMNQPIYDMLGFTKETLLIDGGWLRCLHPDNAEAFKESYYNALKKKVPFEIEGKVQNAKKETIWIKCNCIPEIENEKINSFIGTIVNISDLKKTEDELHHLSFYDPLTGLPNRRSFEKILREIIEECKQGSFNPFAVLYVDLDHFKTVNDTLGHHCGDELLKRAAKKFQSVLREYDIIARIGGDEFLVFLKNIKSVGEIAYIVDRFLVEFRVPFYINDNECLTTLSMGVVYVEDMKDVNVENTIQQADQALYRAKARGRNCYELYTNKISHEIQHKLYIEKALQHAIEKNELSIYFQSEMDLKKNKIFGFEVLARWKDEAYGFVAPSIFIPIAEESGQINQIGEWIIDSAFKSYKKLQENVKYFQRNHIYFSVNISPKQFLQKDFLQVVKKKLKYYNMSPDNIIFEITETALIQNFSYFKDQISELSKMGIRIAIDDFGTGYSSFTNLKELPISVVKIDQSFVSGIENDNNCRTIIKSAVSLGNEMGLDVIAEGVATKEQADFLIENGCHIFQGYYYSQAIPELDIKEFISGWEKNQ